MSAILTGGNKRPIYTLLQLGATCFILTVLMACAKVPAPTQVQVNETPEPLQSAQTVPVPQERFDIGVYLDNPGTFPLEVSNAIIWARDQWEGVIVGGLPDMPAFTYSHISAIPPVARVDDLLVKFVWKVPTNPNAVATTHLTVARSPTMGGLPFYAEVWLYDYLNTLTQAQKRAVILHEIGHALGFSDVYIKEYLEVVSSVKYYSGAHGVQGYREVLYHLGEKLSFAIPDLRIPMEMETTHWKYPEMMWDIMQPYVAPQSVISKVTLGMLHDLGHVVDYNKAQMPHPVLTKPAIGQPVFKHVHDHTHIHIVVDGAP